MKGKKRVEETRTRSLAKVITGRVLEILVDTFLLDIVIKRFELSLALSLAIEFLCAFTHYINERLWNLTDFGRKVKNGVCSVCGKKIKKKRRGV